jgi:hypothetical protein
MIARNKTYFHIKFHHILIITRMQRKWVSWIDPLHNSTDLLHFPFHHTPLYSPLMVSIHFVSMNVCNHNLYQRQTFSLLEIDGSGSGREYNSRQKRKGPSAVVIINGTSFGGLSVDVCVTCASILALKFTKYLHRSLRTGSCGWNVFLKEFSGIQTQALKYGIFWHSVYVRHG